MEGVPTKRQRKRRGGHDPWRCQDLLVRNNDLFWGFFEIAKGYLQADWEYSKSRVAFPTHRLGRMGSEIKNCDLLQWISDCIQYQHWPKNINDKTEGLKFGCLKFERESVWWIKFLIVSFFLECFLKGDFTPKCWAPQHISTVLQHPPDQLKKVGLVSHDYWHPFKAWIFTVASKLKARACSQSVLHAWARCTSRL